MSFRKDNSSSDSVFFYSDEQFDKLYPAPVQKLAQKHFTPLQIAVSAATYLAEKNARILDIGSGVGKFCLAAAYHFPNMQFTGIEIRPGLVDIARQTAQKLALKNVEFLAGDFDQLDFSNYDHFYFYNSFYEHIVDGQRIDEEIDFSENKFHQYNRKLHQKLSSKPVGTRLATYHSLEFEIPRSYTEMAEEGNDLLKFWLKTEEG